MTNAFPYPEPLSHPPSEDDAGDGVRLTDHLDEVADRTAALCPDTTTPGGTPLADIGRIIGLLHDFGKLTTHFQRYVAKDRDGDRQTYHSQLGAALTLYVISEDDRFDVSDALLGFTAVAKHHGRLPNVVDDAVGPNGFFERHGDNIQEQAENVHENAPDIAQDIIARTDTSATLDGFLKTLSGGTDALAKPLTDEYLGQMFATGGEDPPADAHDALLALWSALLVADKSAAAGINRAALESEPFNPARIEERIDELWADADEWNDDITRLNTARNRARETAVETARSLPVEGGVATLTLPTGLGKTFAGTQAALDHLRAKRDSGRPGRLVYALPFTSVIDQTEQVFTDVFDADPTGNALTVHHHLSETVTRASSDEDTDEFAARDYLLGETWRAGTVLTTYVQLLESLVGPRNRQALKLSALYGSVVLLDEPQSIPADWWPLFRRLVDVLVNQFEATVILMTATQPRILDATFDTTALIPDPDSYFEAFERVTYTLDDSADPDADPLPVATAGQRVADAFRDGASSVLSITNTIASTRNLYEEASASLATTHDPIDVTAHYANHLDADDVTKTTIDAVRDAAQSENAVAVCQLTTRHAPRDRKALLEVVTQLTETHVPVLLCSTQLVEAGVDISFEQVYRDLAPLDSLVQAAGRCNRSFEWGRGTVTVWHLAPDEDWKSTPANTVYARGLNQIRRTQEALDAIRSDDETALSEATVTTTGVREYYASLTTSNPGNDTYVSSFDALDAHDLRDVSLIETRESIDVFVLRTEADRQRAEKLQNAFDGADYRTAARLKSELAPLRVSVSTPTDTPRDTLTRLPSADPTDADGDLRLLDVADSGSFFDTTNGVCLPTESR